MGQNGSGSTWLSLAPLLLPLLLLLWLVWAGRRRQAATASFQAALNPGDRVCTTSGLFGTIVDLTDETADLEVAPGVVLRFDRRAVGQVLSDATRTDSSRADSSHAAHTDPSRPGAHPGTEGDPHTDEAGPRLEKDEEG